ncbi:Unknown protein sequence [Pseudomonas syringae pv. primulae]|uniref:Uncharacterized protein n=1 Tax=Pseudomonas syringae pv. primulae TaxID=251707 RepID=A0A0P9XSS2_9PSED|nr:Unknown protein sequence [Pseudomonas syringae pv. primulae]
MLGQIEDGLQVGAHGLRQVRAASCKTLQTLMQSGKRLCQTVMQVIGHALAFVFLSGEQLMHQLGHGPLPRHQRFEQAVVLQMRRQQRGEELQGFDVFVVRGIDPDAVGEQQRAERAFICTAQRQHQHTGQSVLRTIQPLRADGQGVGHLVHRVQTFLAAVAGRDRDYVIAVPLKQQAMVHGHEGTGPLQHPLAHGFGRQLGQFLARVHQKSQTGGTALRLAILGTDRQGTCRVMGRALHRGGLQRRVMRARAHLEYSH